MTTPWLVPVLIGFALVVLLALVAPLLRRKARAISAIRFDRAVYRDQLREVERDLARGVLDPGEAASARLEIERRLLATGDAEPGEAPPSRRRLALAAVIALIVAAWATGFYLLLGSPGVPDMPLAARLASNTRDATGGEPDIAAIAARLETRLKTNGGDVDGWLLLARTEAGLQQWDQSAEAYRHVFELAPAQAGSPIDVAYAEALTLAAGGIVTPAAKEALDRVTARDPGNQVARFYIALAAAQAGEMKQAVDLWLRLAQELPPGSEMRVEIERRIDATARQAGIPAPAIPGRAGNR